MKENNNASKFINAIRSKREDLDLKRSEKLDRINERNNLLKKQASDLVRKYGNDMFDIANELQENDFSIKDFFTDGISHRIGFFVKHPFEDRKQKILGIGIECGGCDGNIDLLISRDGEIISLGQVYKNGTMVTLTRFVNCFEDFKNRFYSHLNSNFAKFM